MYEFFASVAAALAVAAPVVQNLGEIAQGGQKIVAFAGDILGRLRKRVPPEKLQAVIRQSFQEAAASPQPDFDRKIDQIVNQVLEDQPAEQKQAAAEYIKLFPERIRANFARQEDPSGTTVPFNFAVNRAEDIVGVIPPRPPQFREGDVPENAPNWTLVERLGIGGFGEVWKAKNKVSLYKAFKFCLDPAFNKFTENEIKHVVLVMKELGEDPNIVRLNDAHLTGEKPWLEYDFVSGGDLSQLISTWSKDITVRATMAVEKLLVLADTIARCHNIDPPVIHRDMKPANVLVTQNGTLKITDFGISDTQARQALDGEKYTRGGSISMTSSATVWGASTPMYASDQQKAGEKPHPADDVHALGVMLYQMILGDVNRPLNRDYIAVLERLNIARELIDLLSKSIASDRNARYQNAGQLADALRALPKKLVVERIVDPNQKKKQDYALVEFYTNEAKTKNAEAARLFDQRQWKHAKQLLDEILHPVMLDTELYNAVSLYADGKRLKNSLGMEFAWVPPGESWLGGGGGTPGTKKFTPEKGFWAGIYPVTQAEWQAVMGKNPSSFGGNPRFPVETVSWNDITNTFLPALNKKCQADGYAYRLPTEDEWEYACRGGSITQAQSAFHYYFAKSKTDLTPAPTNELTRALACFDQDGNGKPVDVGSFLPNSLGLFDMHGNIWEWTASAEGASRVFRGGSWYGTAEYCTACSRSALSPDYSSNCIGFRILAVPLTTVRG